MAGRPLARWTSTLTAGASMPASARLRRTARLMAFLTSEGLAGWWHRLRYRLLSAPKRAVRSVPLDLIACKMFRDRLALFVDPTAQPGAQHGQVIAPLATFGPGRNELPGPLPAQQRTGRAPGAFAAVCSLLMPLKTACRSVHTSRSVTTGIVSARLPLKKAISKSAAAPTTSLPIWRSSAAAASMVPPVASTSSTISTR